MKLIMVAICLNITLLLIQFFLTSRRADDSSHLQEIETQISSLKLVNQELSLNIYSSSSLSRVHTSALALGLVPGKTVSWGPPSLAQVQP